MADAWRLAQSLSKLRDQINHLLPGRAKGSDGTIGDTAHAAKSSDHNPDASGLVTAMDITHDPSNGVIAGMIAEALRINRDPRIKYVIWNKQMFSSYRSQRNEPAWEWRPYTGAPHDKHVHISVAGAVNNTDSWRLV